jgi:hypothetical protein
MQLRHGYTAYRAPRKRMVGIANEKAIFLNTGWSEPNAGDVMYSLPNVVVRYSRDI